MTGSDNDERAGHRLVGACSLRLWTCARQWSSWTSSTTAFGPTTSGRRLSDLIDARVDERSAEIERERESADGETP